MRRLGWSAGGLLAAALGLVVLEVLVTSTSTGGGAAQLPGLLALPAKAAAAWLDPTRPLILDHTAGSASPGNAGTTYNGTTVGSPNGVVAGGHGR